MLIGFCKFKTEWYQVFCIPILPALTLKEVDSPFYHWWLVLFDVCSNLIFSSVSVSKMANSSSSFQWLFYKKSLPIVDSSQGDVKYQHVTMSCIKCLTDPEVLCTNVFTWEWIHYKLKWWTHALEVFQTLSPFWYQSCSQGHKNKIIRRVKRIYKKKMEEWETFV